MFKIACVHVVIDYTDTVSPLTLATWTPAEIVVDYADTMSASSVTTQTRCRHSQQLREHGQDYADTFGKL